MANTREALVERFICFPENGIVQSARGVPVANEDITLREKCTIARELVIGRADRRDCRDEDRLKSRVDTRFRRWTLTYAEVTPAMIARWTALFLGTAAAPIGTPANEVQTLTDGGTDGTVSMTLEGVTATSQNIPTGSSAAEIQDFLTAPRMKFIEPGDLLVGGSGPFTLTFQNRLRRANLPTMSGTGGMSVAATTNGDQNRHILTRSTSREKQLISFCLGWDDDPDRVEKYIDVAVAGLAVTTALGQDVSLVVTLIGPWDYDSIETEFDIPACENIAALRSNECRVNINGVWQSPDVNNLTATVDDSVPTDLISAFGFIGPDIQSARRGTQPEYGYTLSVFGSEPDSIYQDAKNELTVASILHFGLPGNRATWYFDATELQLQSDPLSAAGDENISLIQVAGVALKNGANAPFDAEGYLDQTAQFLQS